MTYQENKEIILKMRYAFKQEFSTGDTQMTEKHF